MCRSRVASFGLPAYGAPWSLVNRSGMQVAPMVVQVLISLKPDYGSDPNRGALQTTVHHDAL